ncbi:MFS transporter [Pseudoxanthomonas sp.]|uniref:MFS transporter n=1 Tax=Pseudoxanthomonas sp. TaxID=1871049 RepID=UPI002633B80B|nr:MFS transporter [Pseudoxanthomonas sp.]WDS34675.1 MAG: MFS transporter [Pseudoxanthomonas sp.]
MQHSSAADRSGHVLVAQVVLGLGGLFLGTAEFAAMGLLPEMAASYKVDVPTAGHLISAYAIGVVLGAPLLAILTARMERRKLLMGLAVLILAGNALSACADNFAIAALARFISGLPHGAYYGTAGLVAASMVPKDKRTQAIGRVMLGLAAANLVGVPLVTWMGQAFGWQSAFGLVAAGGLLLLILLPLTVPQLEAQRDASPRNEFSAFGSLQVWLTLATAAIGFGGMFAVYSYITPTLTEVTGVNPAEVPWFLALWGLGMVVGNTAGGWLADRSLNGAIVVFMIWNVVFLTLFSVAAHSAAIAAVVLFLIGVGFALVPALQAKLMDSAPKAQSLASAMNHSAFNTSNAIGAWTGGLSISWGFGWASTGVIGGILAVGGLAIFVVALSIAKREQR